MYNPAEKLLKQSSKEEARSLVTTENIETASIMLLFTYDLAKIPPFLSSLPRLSHDIAEGTAGFSAENVMLAAATYKMGFNCHVQPKADILIRDCGEPRP